MLAVARCHGRNFLPPYEHRVLCFSTDGDTYVCPMAALYSRCSHDAGSMRVRRSASARAAVRTANQIHRAICGWRFAGHRGARCWTPASRAPWSDCRHRESGANGGIAIKCSHRLPGGRTYVRGDPMLQSCRSIRKSTASSPMIRNLSHQSLSLRKRRFFLQFTRRYRSAQSRNSWNT